MANLVDLEAKWSKRREEWRALGVAVSGPALADEVLHDLSELASHRSVDAITLREGARIGGYSIDHLQRLVAAGKLENVGRKHRPRIRRCDVPSKPGFLLRDGSDNVFSERRRIAASVATGSTENV